MAVDFDSHSILIAACKGGKFGLLIEFDAYLPHNEILQAIPWLNDSFYQYHQIMFDGYGYFIFDSKEEMETHYAHIVGDDGPTKYNKYNGPAKVYALTCDENQFLTENT